MLCKEHEIELSASVASIHDARGPHFSVYKHSIMPHMEPLKKATKRKKRRITRHELADWEEERYDTEYTSDDPVDMSTHA